MKLVYLILVIYLLIVLWCMHKAQRPVIQVFTLQYYTMPTKQPTEGLVNL